MDLRKESAQTPEPFFENGGLWSIRHIILTLSRSAGTVRVDTPITTVYTIDFIENFRESSK
ncbi:MAG: hypothetical protein NTY86_20210, partial [Deltaproteobacteria bacterium]|nr:hypothetical protein [Deltaproteobacteria bacterium]